MPRRSSRISRSSSSAPENRARTCCPRRSAVQTVRTGDGSHQTRQRRGMARRWCAIRSRSCTPRRPHPLPARRFRGRSRLLPIPGGPTTPTTHPLPLTARSRSPRECAHLPLAADETRSPLDSAARPVAIASRRRAGTGSSAPLMCTSSASPKMAAFSTRRAVDSLTITPPGGATDSIRCAMPTCSPMAV